MIRIGFSTQRFNPLAMLIRKVTGAECSHTFLIADDTFLGTTIVMQAGDFGYGIQDWTLFQSRNQIIAVVDVGADLQPGIHLAAISLGSYYNYLGLLGTIVVMLGRWLKRKWNNPVHAARAMFCSESVVKILTASKYPGADTLIPEDTTPQDLLVFLSKPQEENHGQEHKFAARPRSTVRRTIEKRLVSPVF